MPVLWHIYDCKDHIFKNNLPHKTVINDSWVEKIIQNQDLTLFSSNKIRAKILDIGYGGPFGHLHNLSPKSLLGFYRCWRGSNLGFVLFFPLLNHLWQFYVEDGSWKCDAYNHKWVIKLAFQIKLTVNDSFMKTKKTVLWHIYKNWHI